MAGDRGRSILDDERIGRLLIKLTIPAFFGMFVMTLYNVVDTIFIGHYVGPIGIAGLSIVFPIQMLAMGMGQMTGMGGASLISRLIGEGKTERAELALGNSVSATFILSLVVLIVGLSNPDYWLRLMGSSDSILPYAKEYMVIILFGMMFMTLGMAFNGLARSEGNANVAMVGVIIGAGLNIVLDAIFIIPLEMGIRGAAWATVIAQLISVLYFARYYLSGKSHLKFHTRNLIPNFGILKPIFAIGVASLAMTLAGSLSAILINRVLGEYGGDYAISTFGILNRILMFAIMPGMVIGQGLQPILGYNYGAGRYKLALKAIKIALVYATCLCFIAFILLYFFPEIFIRIFSSDADLIEMASHAARRTFIAIYIIGVAFIGQLIFQSLGKAVKAFITSLARPALFMIPMIMILPRFWGVDGVWLAFPFTDGLTVILTVILLIPEIREFQRGAPPGRKLPEGVPSMPPGGGFPGGTPIVPPGGMPDRLK
jgi:putative MATE family efflux protein